MYTSGTSSIEQLKEVIGSGLTHKPREIGLTAVLDKGLGLRAMRDLVELSGPYIDTVKFGWGLSTVSSPDADGQDYPLADGGDCRVPRRNAARDCLGQRPHRGVLCVR